MRYQDGGGYSPLLMLCVFGVSLLVLSAAFSIDIYREAYPPLNWRDIAWMCAKDGGAIVALEAALGLLYGMLLGRVWRATTVSIHGLLFLVITVNHQFYLHTGSNLDAGLIFYGLRNSLQLLPVLSSGIDGYFAYRTATSCLLFVVACLLVLRGAKAGGGRKASKVSLLFVCMAGLGAATAVPVKQAAIGSLATALYSPGLPSVTSQTDALVNAPEFRITGKPARPHNVVIVVLESFRADVLAFPNSETKAVDTPYLSALAKSGASAESMYTTISHTSKALVGILCGNFPLIRMEVLESLPGKLPFDCLPKLLGAHGYRTAFFQSAPGEFENRRQLTTNMGFQRTFTREDIQQGFEKVGYFGLDERALLEPVKKWASEGGPNLAVLLTSVTHHPYQVPGAPRPTEDSVENYRAAVRHVDSFVGALHEQLTKLSGDTIFVIVGDHGEAFGEHGGMQHDVVPYQEAIRVPLILGGVPSGRIPGLRQHIDILPTLLNLLEMPWAGYLPGKDLLSSDGHESVYTFCWYNNRCASMITENRKFIYHFSRKPMEVYELAPDPHEQVDIAASLSTEELTLAERLLVQARVGTDARYLKRLQSRTAQ